MCDLLTSYEQDSLGSHLSDAATILQSAPHRMTVDPQRSDAAARLGMRMLDISVDLHDPRILDWGIQLMKRERSMLASMMDLSGEVAIAGALGALLAERYHVGKNLEDASEALDVLHGSAAFLQLPGVVDPWTACVYWWTLGNAVAEQADITHRVEHHRESVDAHRRALDLAVTGSVLRTQVEVALTQAEQGLAARVALDDEDEARVAEVRDAGIERMRRAVEREDVSDDVRHSWFHTLAHLLLDRHSEAEVPDEADLDEAARAIDRGLTLAHAQDRVPLLALKADLLRVRGEAGDSADATGRALAAAAEAGQPDALRLGVNAVVQALRDGDPRRGAEAGDVALGVLARVLSQHLAEEYHHVFLGQADRLAALTAFAWHRCGRPDLALSSVERARATVWRSRYLEARARVRALRARGLEDEAERYATELRVLRDSRRNDADLRAAQSAIDALVSQLPDTAPSDGPTVSSDPTSLHLIATGFGGLAIVAGPSGDVSSVELPDLTDSAVHELARPFRTRVVRPDNAPSLRSRTVIRTIAVLDDLVHRPLAASGAMPEHATLVPTGQLTGLPLHARPSGPHAALSTTVPSLKMLPARTDRGDRRIERVLVVADRSPQGSVPGVEAEVASVRRAFPDARVLDDVPELEELLRLVGAHDLVHFCCHGINDDLAPLESRLLVGPRREVRLADLLLAELESEPIIVLSACQSAVHGTRLPDESQSLPAGLLAVAARAVIASLWPVPGAASATMMGRVYDGLGAGVDSATALVAAQRALADGVVTDPAARDDWTRPYFWAGFVHFGAAVSSGY